MWYDDVNSIADIVDALDTRIDNIVAVPPGSTESNAELIDIRVGKDGITYQTAGEAIRANDVVVDNTLTVSGAGADAKKTGDELTGLKSAFTKTTETVLLATDQGKYVSYLTGQTGNAANYTLAKADADEYRIPVPYGCSKITFNNAVFVSAGVNGWCTYSANTGTEANDYVRGEQSSVINVQENDKYFSISSGKSNGAFVTSISVTYTYGFMSRIKGLEDSLEDSVDALEDRLDNIKKGKETILYSPSNGQYVNATTGATGNAANYSLIKNSNTNLPYITIPDGCVKIVFNNIIVPDEGVSGWAIYNGTSGSETSTFVRGGRTKWIDVIDGDVTFAVSSAKNSGEYIGDFSITYIFSSTESRLIDVSEVSIDSFNKNTTAANYIDYTDGTIHSMANGRYAYVNNITIPKNVTKILFPDVVFIVEGVAGWAVYNSNGTYIRGGQTNYVDIKSGDAFLGITAWGTPAPTAIDYTFVYGKINEEIYELQKSIYGTNKISNNECKVVMLGDSIVGNFDGSGSIPVYLSDFTGATCYNCAIGGSSLGSDLIDPDEFFEAFNGWKMIHAIATNNYSVMQTAIDNNPSRVTYQQDHLDILKNMDWSTVDIITLSYGTNDWGTKVTLDDTNNPKSTNTFTGALRTSLEELWSVYPHIKVIVFGIIWRGLTISNGQITGDTDDGKHGRDWYLYEYEEKLQEVCEEYHVPFVPMYNHIGFNRYNWSVYFPSTDGSHPNAVGRKAIAKRYAAHLIELTKN